VIQFFSQMLKVPIAAAVAGFEIFTRIMRDMQQTFDRSVDTVAQEVAQSLKDVLADTQTLSQGGTVDEVVPQDGIEHPDSTVQANGGNMGDWDARDQDLSGEDLKVVQYRIIFTKRDYEATLYEHEETLNYPTDGGSYGGLRVAQFMGRLGKNGREVPSNWRDGNKPKYPPEEELVRDGKYFGIPEDDQRYITFIYQVVRHVEREEKEYDKEQVRILGQIRDRL
jgi:hypothetical protein